MDTGCSKSIISPWLSATRGNQCSVVSVDGSEVPGRLAAGVPVVINGKSLLLECVVMSSLLHGVEVIFGMDLIAEMGGVSIKEGSVSFGGHDSAEANAEVPPQVRSGCALAYVDQLKIDDKDFSAKFDGHKWTVRWNWKDDVKPQLRNQLDCYSSANRPGVQEGFEAEVNQWIEKGWLKLCESEQLPAADEHDQGIIPLMAVVQENKLGYKK